MKLVAIFFSFFTISACSENISVQQVFVAVGSNNTAELDKYLTQGGNPNALNERGDSLLYVATGPHGGNDVLIALLDSGANPNLGSKYGYTPLMNASSWCDLNGVKTLLANSADPKLKNSRGETALNTVCYGGKYKDEVIQSLKKHNKVKNLHSLRSFGRAENARPF